MPLRWLERLLILVDVAFDAHREGVRASREEEAPGPSIDAPPSPEPTHRVVYRDAGSRLRTYGRYPSEIEAHRIRRDLVRKGTSTAEVRPCDATGEYMEWFSEGGSGPSFP